MSITKEKVNQKLAENLYMALWEAIEEPMCRYENVCQPNVCDDVVQVIMRLWLEFIKAKNSGEIEFLVPLELVCKFTDELTEARHRYKGTNVNGALNDALNNSFYPAMPEATHSLIKYHAVKILGYTGK